MTQKKHIELYRKKGWSPTYLKLGNFHFIFQVLFSLVQPGLVV
jgi:hypothetical protein